MAWLNLDGGAALRLVALYLCLAALCAGLAVSSTSPAVFLGAAAGIAVRSLVRRWELRRASRLPGRLASFQFTGGQMKCFFDDAVISGLIGSWRGRLLALVAAGGVCFAALHGLHLRGNPVTAFAAYSRLPAHLVAALPFVVAAVFFLLDSPEERREWEIKATVSERAAASMEQILSHREIAGLAAGAAALWQALGVERRDDYQTAMEHYLRVHSSEAVLRPENGSALLETLIELGRQDVQHLGRALAIYRSAERHVGSVTMLAAALRNQVYEARAEALSADLDDLRRYAAQRRWEEFEPRAAALEHEASDLANDLRARPLQGPPVVLAPGSDPYRLLGIDADTPTPAVRKLRLRLAQLYHPDVYPDGGESKGNSAKMAEVNAAYDAVLLDREKRRRSAAS